MSNLSILYMICAIGLLFVIIRGGIVDLETEYVPDNIVIGSYFFAITYIVGACIIQKDLYNIKIGALGFFVGFGVPYILMNVTYYYRLFSWKMNNKGEKLPEFKEDLLTENPKISKKKFIYLYLIGIVGICISVLITKNYWLLLFGAIGLICELILGRLLKKFYVIKIDYAADKYKEKTPEQELEEYLYSGIGGGDIILFGAIGIMFGVVGFIITLIYAIFAHILIIIIYSLVRRINPFKHPIPFLPAIAAGILIYSCGLDQYLLNFFNLLTSIM